MGYQLHNLYGAFEQLFEETARFFENRVGEASCRADLRDFDRDLERFLGLLRPE